MDRRTFLGRFGMGIGAVILAPKIIASSVIKPDHPALMDNTDVKWDFAQIFIRVVNTNPTPTEVMLFGANKNITGNFIPEGIKIFIAGYTMQQINSLIRDHPVRIEGLKIKALSMNQLINPLSLYLEHKDGRLDRTIFQPINYRKPSDEFTIIDCPGFELILTPEIYIINKINPNEQVDYMFTIGSLKTFNKIYSYGKG